MVVKQSSPCSLFTASFNVLQSSGTRTESVAVVAVVVEEAAKDVFVSPVTTDADCTEHQQYTKQYESEAVIKSRKEKGENLRVVSSLVRIAAEVF